MVKQFREENGSGRNVVKKIEPAMAGSIFFTTFLPLPFSFVKG
jgi:hypothetical protein